MLNIYIGISLSIRERHNRRGLNTLDFMKSVVRDGVGKRLTYSELVGKERVIKPQTTLDFSSVTDLVKDLSFK